MTTNKIIRRPQRNLTVFEKLYGEFIYVEYINGIKGFNTKCFLCDHKRWDSGFWKFLYNKEIAMESNTREIKDIYKYMCSKCVPDIYVAHYLANDLTLVEPYLGIPVWARDSRTNTIKQNENRIKKIFRQ